MKQFLQQNKNNKGQSLVELLVAIFVLTIIFLTVALLSVRSVKMSQESLDRQKALSIIKNMSEIIRQKKDNSIWEEFVETGFCGNESFEFGREGDDLFDPEYEMSAYDCVKGDNMKEVTVTVSWGEDDELHSITENLQFYNY